MPVARRAPLTWQYPCCVMRSPPLWQSELTAGDSGLVVLGEATIERGCDRAITDAVRVVKGSVDAPSDDIAGELQEALQS